MKMRVLYFIALWAAGLVLPAWGQTGDWERLLRVKDFAEIVRRSENFVPDTAASDVLCQLAQAYEGLSKPREAYELYRICFRRDSADLELLFKMSELTRGMGRDREARDYLVRVLERDSANFYARTQLAQLDTRLKDYERAVDTYNGLLKEDSLNSYLWYGLGECYSRKEEPIRAALAFQAAYAYNRENETMAVQAISSLIAREAAPYNILALCDTALHYLPGSLRVLQLKGITLYNAKRYEEAAGLFGRLLQSGDSSLVNMKYSGIISCRLKQYGDAVRCLQEVYPRDSMDIMVNLTLAASLTQENEPQQAFRLLDKVERDLQPDTVTVQLLTEYRGQAYRQAGNPGEAARCYYELYDMDNRRIDALDAIVRAYPPVSEVTDQQSREIILFAAVKLVRECLARGIDPAHLQDYKALLTYCHEDSFFRGQKSVRMRAPGEKPAEISGKELVELISKIPDRE